MKSFKWRKEKPTKGWVYPTSREGHSITYITKHDTILLFGGLSNTRMNDLYLYDIKDNVWRTQATSGRTPSARCYHSAFYDADQDNYYLYAGQGDKGRSMGDFYYLNMKNWVWKKLFIQEIPPSRHHHVFTEISNSKKERIIFGGYTLPENVLLNDVWVFDYKNLVSSSSLQDISGAKCTRILQVTGEIPTPRRGMASFSSDKKLFIFGGMTQDKDEETNQLYCLSYDTWVWAKIESIGQPPPSRSFSSCSIYTNRRVLFFGGIDNDTNKATNEVNILTLNDNYWSSPFQAGIKASARYHHSSCMVEPSLSNEKYLVVLGGLDFTFCGMELNILYEAEIDENLEWEKLQEPTQLDALVQEKAGLTILDHNEQIDHLNQLISNQGMISIQLSEEDVKLNEKEQSLEKEHQSYADQLDKELEQLQNEEKRNQSNIENMFVMIRQEQLYCKEILAKNKLLEFTMQKLQDYLMPLDQFYQQLQQNQFDEKDSKEIILKQIVDNSKDEINKARDLHKESLYKLKKNYEKMTTSISKCDVDIEKNKKKITDINKEYEQLILETEIDDYF